MLLMGVCLLAAWPAHAKRPKKAEVIPLPRLAVHGVAWSPGAYGRGVFVWCGAGHPCREPVLPQAVRRCERPRLLAVVRFAFDSARLDERARRVLAGVRADGPVEVQGYTDAVGSKPYNDRLAMARARAAARFLRAHGVDVMRVRGRGKCCYVAAPKDARNRRAEIIQTGGEACEGR